MPALRIAPSPDEVQAVLDSMPFVIDGLWSGGRIELAGDIQTLVAEVGRLQAALAAATVAAEAVTVVNEEKAS